MFRSGHFFYDLRQLLGSARLIIGLAVIGFLLIVFFSFQFFYVLVLVFLALMAARVLIGRRCPKCDGVLKETEAELKKGSAFVMVITWACPRDGHTQTEETKSKIGLFGNQ
jgi:hypothetical protein